MHRFTLVDLENCSLWFIGPVVQSSELVHPRKCAKLLYPVLIEISKSNSPG